MIFLFFTGMEKSLVESKPNDPGEVSENYENLPFHGLQSVPANKVGIYSLHKYQLSIYEKKITYFLCEALIPLTKLVFCFSFLCMTWSLPVFPFNQVLWTKKWLQISFLFYNTLKTCFSRSRSICSKKKEKQTKNKTEFFGFSAQT